MTDPAQVTEPVSWWQAALGGGAIVAGVRGLFGLLTRRTETAAQVTVAQVQAQASREADVTGAHRIATEAAAQVEVAHTQAETQAEGLAADMLRDEREGHKGCREEVREVRAELTKFAVALAKCEAQHEAAARERERDKDDHAREMDALRREIARVDRKSNITPANGTPKADAKKKDEP